MQALKTLSSSYHAGKSKYGASSIIRPCWATFFQNLGRISIWPDKKSIYRRVPTVHHLHHT